MYSIYKYSHKRVLNVSVFQKEVQTAFEHTVFDGGLGFAFLVLVFFLLYSSSAFYLVRADDVPHFKLDLSNCTRVLFSIQCNDGIIIVNFQTKE